MLIAQAVQPSEPKRGFGIGGIEAADFLVLFDGTVRHLGLRGGGQIAQAAQVNAAQQPPRLHVIRVALEKRLGFRNGIVDPLRFPVHLGKPFADIRRRGIERVGLLIGINGLGGVIGLVG